MKTDPGSRFAVHAVAHGSQGEQAAGLMGIAAEHGQPPQLICTVIVA
jgi:hypothetical protein